MIPTPRDFAITSNGSPAGSTVEVDGHDVTRRVRSFTYRHAVGFLPVPEIELHAFGMGQVGGQAIVRTIVCGEEFTHEDLAHVRACAEASGNPAIRDIADRLERILPPLPVMSDKQKESAPGSES